MRKRIVAYLLSFAMMLMFWSGSVVTILADELPSVNAKASETNYEATASLSISTQPSNVTTTAGQKATFKVTATGGTGTLSYQWQYSADSGTTWAKTSLDGSKTATLSFTAKADYSGRKWRCVVTDSSGTKVTSKAVLLTVNAKPSFSKQPANLTTTAGQTASFKVTASGGTGTLSYQWQYSADNGSTWANTSLSGSKTDTLSFTAKTDYSGRKWRCVVTDSKGAKATSSAALLTVNAKPSFSSQPSSTTVTAGQTATFKVTATGGTGSLSYQWQYSADNGSTWANTCLNGSKTATLSFTAKTDYNGRVWRCVVKDSKGAKVTSSSALLTVKAPLPTKITPDDALTVENVIALLEAYDPDGAFILKNTSQDSILFWMGASSGNATIGSAITQFDPAVHEQCHEYTSYSASAIYNSYTGKYMSSKERIYTGNGNSVLVDMTACFDSREIVSEVPDNLRTHRFTTYVDTDQSSMASRQHGVYGLLNEYTAYCWGMNATNKLYPYMEEYGLIPSSGSNIYVSFAEFRYYILKYMLYAKAHYPAVYNEILANSSFRKAFTTVDTKFQKAIDFYRSHYRIYFESEYQALMAEMEKSEYQQMLQLLKP